MKEIIVRTWTEKEYLKLKEDCIVVFWMNKERVIPISQIVSIEIKDPKSKMRPGMITIQLSGTPNSYIKLTSFLSVGNSSNVEFPHGYDYLEEAHEIQRYIENYRVGGVAVPQSSVADEIKKFKDLLDIGAITEDEFDKKKKQLLGL